MVSSYVILLLTMMLHTPVAWVAPAAMTQSKKRVSAPLRTRRVHHAAPSPEMNPRNTANTEKRGHELSEFDTWLRDGILLGVEPSPDVFAIVVVYFVQGALGIARLATAFFLKDELGLNPAESAALLGVTSVPWVIKPVYGFLSDSVPLFGYRRKSYLALAGLLGSCAWLCLGLADHPKPWQACLCLTATSLGVAVSDVVVDSIVVAKARDARMMVMAAKSSTVEVAAVERVVNINKDHGDTSNSGYGVHDGSNHVNNPEPSTSTANNGMGGASGSGASGSGASGSGASSSGGGGGEEGALQSLCWGANSIGSCLSAYTGGALLDVVPAQNVFLCAALFPLLVAGISTTIDETPVLPATSSSTFTELITTITTDKATTADHDPVVPFSSPSLPTNDNDDSLLASSSSSSATPPLPTTLRASFQARADLLWSAVSQRSVWMPAAFLFAWKATPNADQAFFYFATGELGFTPEFLGRVSLVGSVASLAGVVAYQKWLKFLAPSQVLKWTTLLGLPPALLQLALITHLNRELGISDEWFTLTDDAVLAALGQIGFMPTLVLAARLCPPGIEGTLFALLMSVYNGAGIIGQETGALLTSALGVTDKDFDNLASLVALCSLSSLLPLPFLGVLREVERAEEEKEAKKEEGEEKRRVDGGDETKYSGAFDKEE